MGVLFFTTSNVFNTTVATSPCPELIPESEVNNVFPPSLQTPNEYQDTTIEKEEELRAYHAYCDKLHDRFAPDPDLIHQSPSTIKQHHLLQQTGYENRKVFFQVSYCDGHRPNQIISLDDLCIDDSWLCIRYADQHNLLKKPGWEWVSSYIESDPILLQMIHTYRMSVLYGKYYKFGVEVPKKIKDARRIDSDNHDHLWENLMQHKINQILHEFKAFQVLEKDEPTPPGYRRVPYHMTFDFKVDLRWKSRLVIDGNRSPPVHKEECFASVVTLEAVRLDFLMAKMHGLQVVAADVGNAYLTAYTEEKLYIIAGDEFGPEYKGKRLLVEDLSMVLVLVVPVSMNRFLPSYEESSSTLPKLTMTCGYARQRMEAMNTLPGLWMM